MVLLHSLYMGFERELKTSWLRVIVLAGWRWNIGTLSKAPQWPSGGSNMPLLGIHHSRYFKDLLGPSGRTYSSCSYLPYYRSVCNSYYIYRCRTISRSYIFETITGLTVTLSILNSGSKRSASSLRREQQLPRTPCRSPVENSRIHWHHWGLQRHRAIS